MTKGVSTAGVNAATWQLGDHTVRVSHLDKLHWPEDELTKGDILTYYREVAPAMLPHLAGRPVTLRVFPDGIHGESYYQREIPSHAPRWFRTTEYAVQSDKRTIPVPLVDDAAGLVWLANKGCIELHPWSSRLPDLNEPDQAVFDLDPGDEASFADVLQAALHLREELARQRVQTYAKTGGWRGLHVHLLLAPGHHYDDVRSWVKSVAERLEATHGELIAVARGATRAGRRVTIDYAQDSIARSMAAAYTVRRARGPGGRNRELGRSGRRPHPSYRFHLAHDAWPPSGCGRPLCAGIARRAAFAAVNEEIPFEEEIAAGLQTAEE